MKTALKWLGRAAVAIIALFAVALAVVYIVSEQRLRKTHDVPVSGFVIPDDSASIAAGQRLAQIRGCYGGCHGSEAQGELFVDSFLFGSVKSPDLTRLVATLSPGELERVIRRGIRPNGEGVLVMPSSTFFRLSDEDLGAILAFLGSLPRTDGPETSVRLGPLARVFVALGEVRTEVDRIDPDAPRPGPGDGSDPVRLGRYLAMTTCMECHGPDLRGKAVAGFKTPSLAIAQAYGLDEFRRLMADGTSLSGRELDVMPTVSSNRFSLFTESEVEAIHTFLLDEFGTAAANSE